MKASRAAGLVILILIIAGLAYTYYPPFPVDYIKFDIEDAETKALAGAGETPKLIPEVVRAAQPDYEMQCGPC